MSVYWLVLVYIYTTGTNAATSNMLHVGNFKDQASCVQAGASATPKNRAFTYLCIQANENGTTPPDSKLAAFADHFQLPRPNP